jgi:hypothetical protein
MKIRSILASLLLLSLGAGADVVRSTSHVVKAEIQFVRVSVRAKCIPPRFEDGGFRVYYDDASFRLISSYGGYSSKLLGRTCGASGKAELAADRFESVEVLLYSFGAAKADFDAQIQELVADEGA